MGLKYINIKLFYVLFPNIFYDEKKRKKKLLEISVCYNKKTF